MFPAKMSEANCPTRSWTGSLEKADYRNEAGNIVIDADVAKEYKADAAGYCSFVPGYCVNGFAFDSQNYRKYRLATGA
jgi:hypothetical protein